MEALTKFENSDEALIQFELAATRHAIATENGDYETANKSYAIIIKAVILLKKENEVLRLAKCLSNSSMGVRMWSATYLLPVIENDAVKVLKEIIETGGIHAFTARITLEEWQKGSLNLITN